MSHAELNVYTAETARWTILGLVAGVLCGNTDVNIAPLLDRALVRGDSNDGALWVLMRRDVPMGNPS